MCGCIDRINAKLKERNTELSTCFDLENTTAGHRLLVGTNKIDRSKRGRPVLAVATFCPFCGEKMENPNDG
jgi:hypothetical protein